MKKSNHNAANSDIDVSTQSLLDEVHSEICKLFAEQRREMHKDLIKTIERGHRVIYCILSAAIFVSLAALGTLVYLIINAPI